MRSEARRAWRPMLTADSPWEAVQLLIEEYVEVAVADLRGQLEADPDFTARERSALVARATPLIRQRTAAAIEAGWHDLQWERSGGTRVH